MWDEDRGIHFTKLERDVGIPADFDLYSLVMPDDLKEKMEDLKIVDKEDSIEEISGGMKKLNINSIFEKHIPKNDWYRFFHDELQKDYFKEIEKKYQDSLDSEKEIYPKIEDTFRAFNLSSLDNIKIVIIGQDPYPGICRKTQVPFANGLAFSVNKECSIPASLRNMYKELKYEGYEVPKTGELENWAKQGVFLLNTQLSVEKGNANSHKFWKKFTDNVIQYLCKNNNKGLIFVLMGGSALKKYKLIPKNKLTKFVIRSHPSPLGYKKNLRSYPPFFESDIFKITNMKLKKMRNEEIKW